MTTHPRTPSPDLTVAPSVVVVLDAGAWPRSLGTTLHRQPLRKRIPLATEALAVAGAVLEPLLR